MATKARSIGIGLAFGALAGLAVGMLIAPRSGRDTRTMIKEKAESVVGRIKRIKSRQENL